MSSIRPEILRQYYEATYGKQIPSSKAFTGATFEEYYTLIRITFPRITRWNAAQKSRRPEFRKFTETFEPDLPSEQELCDEHVSLQKRYQIRRLSELDLREAPFEDDLEDLLLDRIESVTGFERFLRLKQLYRAIFVFCSTSEVVCLNSIMPVNELTLKSCNTAFLNTVLTSTSSKTIVIQHLDTPIVDLALLTGHTCLGSLHVFAGFVRNLRYLERLPLKRLVLSNVEVDDEFRRLLTAHKDSLSELCLENEKPFSPDAITQLSMPNSLRLFKIPGYVEYRSEWIDFAVSHPHISFDFDSVKEPFKKMPKVEVVEIYRGVDILKLQKGKKVSFEVWGNLAGDLLKSEEMDNHDLGDLVRSIATKEKKKVEVSSSADELVIQTTRMEDSKWCIDRILEKEKGRRA